MSHSRLFRLLMACCISAVSIAVCAQAKKNQGQYCAAGSECITGFCADGVCADRACTGVCEKANQPGRIGFCDAIQNGADPDNECPGAATCNGMRACTAYLTGIALTPDRVSGGSETVATVSLSASAPYAGYTISLSSSNTAVATVESTVTVPAGQANAPFKVTAKVSSSEQWADISAGAGGLTKTARVTVTATAPSIKGVELPSSVIGGQTASGNVSLDVAAPSGGLRATVLTADASVSGPPETVAVPGGSSGFSFRLATKPVPAARTVNVTVKVGSSTASKSLAILPPRIKRLTTSPATISPGSPARLTIELTGAAPEGGYAVQLASSNPQRLVPPTTVLVSAGSTIGVAALRATPAWTSAPVTLTATAGGASANVSVTVLPK